jgi:hypothetical protein
MNLYLEMFDMTQSEFLMSMHKSLGEEGTKTLLTKSIKKLTKDGPFKIEIDSLEVGSYVELDFKNSSVYVEEINDERYATVLIENWDIPNSSIIYLHINDDGEEEMKYFDIDGLLDFLWDENPYDYSDALNEWVSFIAKQISSYMGTPIGLADRVKK